MRILTVEDEASTADSIRMLFESKLKASVDLAKGCRQAWDLFQTNSYDLVTIDYQMPDCDGLALLRKIMEVNGKIPVIMVTGHGDEETAINAFKFGASGYVVKDLRMATMLIEESRSALARSDLIKAEYALRESEEKYRTLFETMLDGFAFHEIVTNDEGKPIDYVFLEVNSAFENMVGLKAENIIGRKVTEALPGIENDPADWIGRYGTVALEGEDTRFEAYAESLGKWFSVYAYSPMERFFATLFEDITERKQSEEAIRRSEERFRLLFENIEEGFALCKMMFDSEGDPSDWIYIKTNRAMEQLTGLYNVDGKYISDVIPSLKETNPELFEVYGRVASTGKSERFEIDVEQLSGVYSVKVFSPMREYFVAVFENITERKTAEKALRTSESILKATERISKVGGWEYNIEKKTMHWTEETYRIHDLNPGTLAPEEVDRHIQQSLECYDPKDREVIMSTFERCINEGVPYDLEVPFTTCSGRRLWIRTVAEAVYEEGRVIKIIGNLMDITERKTTEEKLLQANAELEKLVRDKEDG